MAEQKSDKSTEKNEKIDAKADDPVVPQEATDRPVRPASVGPEYNAKAIKSLDDVEHVRTRPGMYIGGYNPRGLHHLVYEIVDNSIDEALAGYAKHVEVRINT